MPLLEGRIAGEAYFCRNGSCELPARSVEVLREQLAKGPRPARSQHQTALLEGLQPGHHDKVENRGYVLVHAP